MRRLNNKGYMLVEIILAFSICFALMYFLMDIVIKVKNKNDDMLVSTIVATDQNIITNRLMDYAIDKKNDFDCSLIKLEGQKLTYNGDVLGIVSDNAKISLDGEWCKNDDDLGKISIHIPVVVNQIKDSDFDILIDYRYSYEESFTISYDANGGSGAPATVMILEGESYTISSVVPVRGGYAFLGWNTDKNATSANYIAGDSYSVVEDLTLYAIWKSAYTVKYDANGGVDKGLSEQIKNVSEPLRLKDEIPTRVENYTYGGKNYDVPYGFMGWSTLKKDEFSPSAFRDIYWPYSAFRDIYWPYSANNKYFMDIGADYIDEDYLQYYTNDEDVTLYAVWKNLYDTDYTLIFDVNMVARNDYDKYLNYNVLDNNCYYYNGEIYDNVDDSFPKSISVYIDSVLGSSYDIYEEDVTDFFDEVNVGDKWYIIYNGDVLGQGVIGDGSDYLYYGGTSSEDGTSDWYYFEYIVDLSNNGVCR